jgi:hypothetical protein
LQTIFPLFFHLSCSISAFYAPSFAALTKLQPDLFTLL